MTQDKISALLGRPLSQIEKDNFSLYLQLAQDRVSDMFCVNICQVFETRRFSSRSGYRTLSVPIFSEIETLKVDGVITTAFEARQGSDLNGEWFNSIVFDTPLRGQTVEIEADWGFYSTPVDVQLLIAELFGMLGKPLEGDLIQSKQVEDFRITLKNKTTQDAFTERYSATIAKYTSCVEGQVQSGYVGYIL